jgi:hypothetical protein
MALTVEASRTKTVGGMKTGTANDVQLRSSVTASIRSAAKSPEGVVDITFSAKATAAGRALVKLPANVVLPGPNIAHSTVLVDAQLSKGDGPAECAQKLAAAITAQAPGYQAKADGAVVHVTRNAMIEKPELLAKASAAINSAPNKQSILKMIQKDVPDLLEGGKFNDGVVSILGTPKVKDSSNPDVVVVTGRIFDNEMWGGDSMDYRFTAELNLKTGLVDPTTLRQYDGKVSNQF